MVDVYENPLCNLSAAHSPDSSGGLFLDCDIKYTKPVKGPFKTGIDSIISYNFWPEDVWRFSLEDGSLLKLGRVLQECLLSCRNMHFKSDQVSGECCSSTACKIFSNIIPFQ